MEVMRQDGAHQLHGRSGATSRTSLKPRLFGQVAVPIVDLLEVVHVDVDQREHLRGALGDRDRAVLEAREAQRALAETEGAGDPPAVRPGVLERAGRRMPCSSPPLL